MFLKYATSFFSFDSSKNVRSVLGLQISLAMIFFFVTAQSTFSQVFAQTLGPCPNNRNEICSFDESGNVMNTVGQKFPGLPEQEALTEAVVEEITEGNTSRQSVSFGTLEDIQASILVSVGGSTEIDQAKGRIDATSGLIPNLTRAISYLYQEPPATTEQYLAYVMHSAGINIAQPAYAQVGGLGFSSLLPVLDTWIKLRNLAYLFFVIVFAVIGFMIMFRQKIGSQTVVTVQQAIPQIIISLLAVTFSFAIAGLLIDLMYLSMFLLIAIFNPTDGINSPYVSGSLFVVGVEVIRGGFSTVTQMISEFVQQLLAIDEGVIGTLIGGAAGLTGAVIFAIAIAIALFRLFFDLLQTYIAILISIVTAPIALMLGAIPGRSNFSTWIWGLIGNLAAFPTVLFVLLLYQSLTNSALSQDGTGFMPPYLIGNGNGDAIQGLIGIGIIMILPTLVKEAKKAFGAKEGVFSQFGAALNDAVKSGWKGGELVPGMGWTNTANFGVSGKGVAKKAGIYGAGAIGGLGGLAVGTYSRRSGNINDNAWKGMKRGAGSFGRSFGSFVGDKQINKDKDPNKKDTKSHK